MSKKPTAQDLKKFRSLLERIKREISGDILNLENDAFTTDGAKASVDSLADSGSDNFSQEFSLELLARDEATLKEVVDALARIDEGSFGRCETCNSWIRKTRLNAVPHARNCIDCQRKAELEA